MHACIRHKAVSIEWHGGARKRAHFKMFIAISKLLSKDVAYWFIFWFLFSSVWDFKRFAFKMLTIRMKKNRLELSLQVLLWAFKLLQITFFILIICMCICVILMYFWFLPGCSQFIVLAVCHKGWDELHWPGPPQPCGLQDPGADPICAGHPVRIWSLEHCCCGKSY